MRLLALTLLLAAPACVPPPPPPAPQPAPKPVAPAPVPVTPPRPSGEWIDWPLAAGDWTYRSDARGSIALFGPPNGEALVTLRCDRIQGKIWLSRAGTGKGNIVVRSSSSMKEFEALPIIGEGYIATDIMPNDPILDSMALSRGRIAIEASGKQSIAIPSWAEITKVVEDCRT